MKAYKGWVCFTFLLLMLGVISAGAVTLGITSDGKYFTLDGAPTYLNGISYYAGCSVSTPSWVTQDLDDMRADGLNWIRVWTHWDSAGSVTTTSGAVREPAMSRLKTIISECNSRGMIVDVTMSRGDSPSPSNQTDHLACARTIATQLLPYRNVYIDIGNERDVGDGRFVSYPDMAELITAIKAIDPNRLCTASGVPSDQNDLNQYLSVGHCDFISTHLCRDAECPAQTINTVKTFTTWMAGLGKRVPVHLQEPFRRDYASYQPVQDDYYRDDGGGKLAEAAGWCLHNGSNHGNFPGRSFDMSDTKGRLYAQLDSVEREVSDNINDVIGGTNPNIRRYQAEYSEQLMHQKGRRDGNAWSANTSQDTAGFLSYGPYLDNLAVGSHRVTWRLRIDNKTLDNNPVVRIDVYSGGQVLVQRVINRSEFTDAGIWQSFNLDFTKAGQQDLEFRTYWYGNSYMELDHVTLSIGNAANPYAPSDPAATNITSSSIRWTWIDNSGDETGFKVYADPGAGPPTTLRATLPANTTFWDYTGLTSSTLYSFQVLAVRPGGDTTKSDNITAQTLFPDGYTLIINDPLTNNTTTGNRVGGTFVNGVGWKTVGNSDGIYYVVNPTIPRGKFEFDVTGLVPQATNPSDGKGELCHMYDNYPSNADVNKNPGYDDNSYLVYIRKLGASYAPANDDAMKTTASTGPGTGTEVYTSKFTWSPSTVYHFTITWEPGTQAGTTVFKYWRDSDLLNTITLTGTYTPQQHRVRIGASTRVNGIPNAIFSNVKVWSYSGPPPVVIHPVSNFTAVSGNGKVSLSWTNPSDPAFAGTMIRYSTSGYPASASEGTLATDKTASPGSSDSYTNTGLVNGVKYYYSAFAHGSSFNYALPTNVLAMPSSAPLLNILKSTFDASNHGWGANLWRSCSTCEFGFGTCVWDSSVGRSGGGLHFTGAGATDNTDPCNREGAEILKTVSTVGYQNIRVTYDLKVNSLGGNNGGTVSPGSCPVDHNYLDEQLTVSYSIDSLQTWHEIDWIKRSELLNYQNYGTRIIDLSGISSISNNPSFVLKFRWQFNTSSDTGDLDNLVISGSPITEGSITNLKQLSTNAPALLGNKLLYLKQGSVGYVEEPDRFSGMRIQGTIPASEGDLVWLNGTIQSIVGGEKYIQVSSMSANGTSGLGPVGVNNRAAKIGSMTGQYVRAWGKVKPSSIIGNSFVITDGSDAAGIKVITTSAPTDIHDSDYVVVTGAAGLENNLRVIYRK